MKLFSTEFVNKEAVKNNIVLLFLYIIATPLSRLFVKLNVSPNKITFISTVFAVLAFVSLVIDSGYIYFCIFWILSLHLDFCDGTVARMTDKVNKTGFRFDHMSDIFKISIVLLGIGIHYNTVNIWILSIVAMFSFLYVTILNHQIALYEKIKNNDPKNEYLKNDKMNLISKAKKSVFIINLFSFLATVNGHTLVFFLLIPFGVIEVEIFLIYFTLLTFSRSIKVINKLVNLPKI